MSEVRTQGQPSALSVVIPTLGRSESLVSVLAALNDQRPMRGDVEVIVALDANAPAHADPSRGAELPMTVVRAERAGASGARNTGWQQANAPLILFLDDDIVPTPGLVAEHLSWHGSNPQPEIGVLGLVRWSPELAVTPFMRWLETGIQFDYGRIETSEVGWAHFYSCNASVKRDFLEQVGGFDEERFPYGYEDLELARRMSDRGFRLLYNPAALGHHLKTETLEGWRRNLRRIALSERRFVTLYPEEEPYFRERFRRAAEQRPARGRAARLASLISPRFPLLGPAVWRSYDAVCSQRLAPEFLAEWDAAAELED